MTEKIEIKSSPIQRNEYDVATELTLKCIQVAGITEPEQVSNMFVKFYATVMACRSLGTSTLINYMPEDLKKIISEINQT